MQGITFDTGALIALERGNKRMRTVLLVAAQDGREITVPAPVLTEWWRGDGLQQRVLRAVSTEPLLEHVAKLAGEAIAAVPGATAVDAMVMASAARRGDVVYTSDIEDLQSLQQHFQGVPKVLKC